VKFIADYIHLFPEVKVTDNVGVIVLLRRS